MFKATIGIPTLRSPITGIVDVPITLISDDGLPVAIEELVFTPVSKFRPEKLDAASYRTMSIIDSDPLNTPPVDIPTTSAPGITYNFVWDAKADSDGDIIPNAVIKVKLSRGPSVSGPFFSCEFSLETEDAPDGNFPHLVKRGDNAPLRAIFCDQQAEPYDPTTVELVSVIDPEDNELVTVPISATQISTGVYEVDFPVPTSGILGDYTGTIEGVLGSDTEEVTVQFQVVEDEFFILSACDPDDTVVYGQLFTGSGLPLTETDIYYYVENNEPGWVNDNVNKNPLSVTTDTNGAFSFTVKRSVRLTIEIPATGYKNNAELPDQDAINFLDIFPGLDPRPRDKFGIPS